MTDEELYWPGPEGDTNDYDDDRFQDDGATTVASGGTGVAPGDGTIPSYHQRRRQRLMRRMRRER